ncbi:MAG: hypothetical protein GW858_04960 [Sphingomonadales bacterium]|nr:hypothetical protein [Sphingomonadales bacterium]NCQ22347.1 hypothetical protein [Sphingomonadales bacterium]NCT03409.1 hypothetical protein [Sphingomonadales bacterium]
MRRPAVWMLGAAVLAAPLAPASWAREVIDAAPPSDIAVTIYRDPDRELDAPLQREYPRGLAMISETRRVTLPKGETSIRFEGVAEGMIGVSAIVTGLPGGTIEKNRNAQLLSPAALVDGTLGNRVTITRTNPATGTQISEQAVVRTRADGGLVLQTGEGFEAVQCSGLPETLGFDSVPAGLSARPVFSVDTRSNEGGTYDVTLTYLAWGFDWQANYVATLKDTPSGQKQGGAFELGLLSWLTLVNDNGQSFDNARLQIIAGKLNIESDYERLADPPVAKGLYLTCYPLGSTSRGAFPPPPPPPPPPAAPQMMAMDARTIVVTGARMKAELLEAPAQVVTADEEDLGDLKLFRVPGRVDVSAKGMKQVAFLNKDAVTARYLYQAGCNRDVWIDAKGEEPQAASLLLVTKNTDDKGLGIALPQGAMTVYQPTSERPGRGPQLAAQTSLRDYARGQDIELALGESAQVYARCARVSEQPVIREDRKWVPMRATLTNANPHPITVRLQLGWAGAQDIRFRGKTVVVKNGYQTVELTVPANSDRQFDWKLRDRSD